MPVEQEATKCPNCRSLLAWQSHTTIWEQGSEVHEFAFLCNSCSREYVFKGDRIIEKKR
jgi:RNase P subunit RPR2